MTRSHGRRADVSETPSVSRLRRLAWLLDASIRVPFTQFRFGLDAVLGLIPGAGDVAGAGLSAYLVFRAWREGVGGTKLARMVGNILVETVVGAVPILGDVFDAAYKSNLRNVKLLLEELESSPLPAEERRGARAGAVWLGIGTAAIVLVTASIVAVAVVGIITFVG